MATKESDWIKMPLDEFLVPANGDICRGSRFWAVTEDKCVLFYKSYSSPCCNTSKEVVEYLIKGMPPELKITDVMFIRVGFAPHTCGE